MALFDLFNPLIQALLNKLKAALGPFGKLFDLITKFFQTVRDAIPKAKSLGAQIYDEVVAWRTFRESIPYRTGVISIPAAIEQTRALISQLVDAWHAVVDLVRNIKTTLEGGDDPADDATTAVEDIEKSGVSGILKQFPKLAKGLEKVAIAFQALLTMAENFVALIDDLQTIVDACQAIREEVESASTVFLSQSNPRKNVKMKTGGSFKIRVGHLHPE